MMEDTNWSEVGQARWMFQGYLDHGMKTTTPLSGPHLSRGCPVVRYIFVLPVWAELRGNDGVPMLSVETSM